MSDQKRSKESSRLAERLGEVEPRADFDSSALRERIAASIEDSDLQRPDRPADFDPERRGFDGIETPGPTTVGRSTRRWVQRLAAAAGFFALGLMLGRTTAERPSPAVQDLAFQLEASTSSPTGASSAIPAPIAPERVAFSIQASGTDYVSSLALLSEMRSQLTPEERQQAKEVALAVLGGAMAELLTTDADGIDLDDLLRDLDATPRNEAAREEL